TADRVTLSNGSLAMASDSSATLAGANDTVSANNASLTLGNGSSASVRGSGDRVTLGSNDALAISGSGNNVTISGTDDVVSAGTASFAAQVFSDNHTVALSDTYAGALAAKASVTLQLNSAASNANLTFGSNTIVAGDASTVLMQGHNNYAAVASNDSATIIGD